MTTGRRWRRRAHPRSSRARRHRARRRRSRARARSSLSSRATSCSPDTAGQCASTNSGSVRPGELSTQRSSGDPPRLSERRRPPPPSRSGAATGSRRTAAPVARSRASRSVELLGRHPPPPRPDRDTSGSSGVRMPSWTARSIDGGEPGVALEPRDVRRRPAPRTVIPVHQVVDDDLLDVDLAERRQQRADVGQERAVRPDHEHRLRRSCSRWV